MTQSGKNFNVDCELRFAHIDGHTDLDFVPGENKILTTGIDCEVRVWSLEDDDVKASFTIDDSAYSIVANRERFYVALSTNSVKSFDLNNGEDEQMVCRFTSNATHLALHPDGELLVAAAADFTIKLLNLTDRTEKLFTGHTGPILSVAIDPLRKYISSSSCDGTVCIWSIETKVANHQWKSVFPVSNDFENSQTLCRMVWEPKFGEIFILPKPECLNVYKRGQWNSVYKTIKHVELKNISIVDFSKDGDLIAAATTESIIMIWKMFNVKNSNIIEPIGIFYNTSCITSMKFCPKDTNTICCCDKSGRLQILKVSTNIQNKKEHTNGTVSSAVNQNKSLSQEDLENIFADIDDGGDFSFVATEKEETNPKLQSLPTSESIDARASVQSPTSIAGDGDDDFDIGAIKSQYEPLIFGDDVTENDNKFVPSSTNRTVNTNINDVLIIDGQRINGKDLLSVIRSPRYLPPTRQQAFQSGSTPVHYKHRFMVWNSVGIVYAYNSDEERSIDVEFHDVSFHHSIHLTNMFNYTIADLSTGCLVLASNGDDESEDELERNKARLFVQLFNTWDNVKEWQVDLSINESIDAICAGQSFIASVTSLRFVRIWTLGGIQTTVFSIVGAAVNISAWDKYLMILYHSGVQHYDQGQCIDCMVLKVDHQGKTRCHPIPSPIQVALSPSSTVYWAGFTDEGTPCVMDSDGIVRLYKTHFGNGWFPICSTKNQANGKSDNFFVIGLSEIQSQIRCIYCKAARYPDTVPKPTLTILPLQIPLCEMFTTKSKHEEECLRNRWLASLLKKLSTDGYDVDSSLETSEKTIINSLIKLFALSLGAERESLALEIAGLMPNRNALEGAVRYAERQHHRSLAMKLVEMIDDNENDDNDDEQNSETELQELLTRKQIDRLRQFVPDTNGHESMISLTKITDNNKLNIASLKPKNLNSKSGPVLINNDNDDDVNSDADIDDETDSLTSRNSFQNPFKRTTKKSTERKKRKNSDDEYSDGENDKVRDKNEIDLDNDPGFLKYYETNREIIFEQYDGGDESDQEIDECQLIQIGKDFYSKLANNEKRKWRQKSNQDKIKSKRSKSAGNSDEVKSNTKKITNFFRKN